MKKFTVLFLFLVALVIVLLPQKPAEAQGHRVDLSLIRHITEPFFDALKDKNIEVRTTYQCGTRYRKDWQPGTYMRLTGKGFVWTDATGVGHLDLFTMNPPMSLEGYRPPMTLNTAPVDQDGNIVVGDPEYWIRYRIWQTRPCVRFSALLQENQGVANAWNYWVEGRTDMSKYRDQWRELGLNDNGTVSGATSSFVNVVNGQLDFQPQLVTDPVNWSGEAGCLQANYSMGQADLGEDGGLCENQPDTGISKSVFGLVVASVILIILMIVIGIKSGAKVIA